jgi:SAM-dependent methyltransferase
LSKPSGPISAALRDRGAIVTGFDRSAKMLALARQRLGPSADLHVADLKSTLPYPDGAFDDVVAALVLHYLQDWTVPLAELRRVLKPGGRLIVAVDHPFAVDLMHREAGRKPDYFATYNHTAEWTMRGHTGRISFWHRPLHAMTDAFTAAAFRIAVISEPPPAPGARKLFPDDLADTPSGAFLCFLFFVLQALYGRRVVIWVSITRITPARRSYGKRSRSSGYSRSIGRKVAPAFRTAISATSAVVRGTMTVADDSGPIP